MEFALKGISFFAGFLFLGLAAQWESIYGDQTPFFFVWILILLPIVSIVIRHYLRFIGAPKLEKQLSNSFLDEIAKNLRSIADLEPSSRGLEFSTEAHVSSRSMLRGNGLAQIIMRKDSATISVHQGTWFEKLEQFDPKVARSSIVKFAAIEGLSLEGKFQGLKMSELLLDSGFRIVPKKLEILVTLHYLIAMFWNLRGKQEFDLNQSLRVLADQIQSNKAQILQEKSLNCIVLPLAKTSVVNSKIGHTNSKKPTIGSEIKGWLLEQKLGNGGFGTVYRATKDFETGRREVAIKVLGHEPSLMDEKVYKNLVKDFLSEAKTSIAVGPNPYVLMAGDFGDEPRPWILYPLVRGSSLGEYVKSKKGLSRNEFWSLAYDLLNGLSYLHEQGVAHRDLKPANIMVTEDQAVILDLGISSVTKYTNTIDASGTLGWIAPELLLPKTNKTDLYAADVFALGLVFFQAIRGQMPWKWPLKNPRLWPQIVQSEQPNLSGLPFEEARLLDNMLQFMPSDRATAQEMLGLVKTMVDIQSKTKAEDDYYRSVFQQDGDVYAPGHDSQFEVKEFIEGPFSDWKQLQKLYEEKVFAQKPRTFYLQLVLENTGVLVFQGMPESDMVFVEVQFQHWHKHLLGPEIDKKLLKFEWTPPTTDAPFFHKYLPKASAALQLTEQTMQLIETVFNLNLSSFAAIAIEAHGRNYNMR